jgi:hypothetical protein
MILGGAAVVAAISLPRNSLASTPPSTADQPSENNNGEDDNMNSTTDIPEAAHTFDPSNFTVVPARAFDDCVSAKSSAHQAAHSPMRTPLHSGRFG